MKKTTAHLRNILKIDFLKIHVCIDKHSNLIDAPQKMVTAISHNAKNNPAKKGTKENQLVKSFVANPMQRITPPQAAVLARMALQTKKKWQPGTTLTISFLNGSDTQKKQTIRFAQIWKEETDPNIYFDFLDKGIGMIRVSFGYDPGSWSYIGTDCLTIAKDQPTMNYGWLEDKTPDEEWKRVVVHEFGHALGCIHEHQNPGGGIKWNKPVVYKYYEGPPNNWTKEAVDSNIFATYSKTQTQFTKLDSNSIMMYPIPKEFTLDGFEVGLNLDLSPTDKKFIIQQYPK